MAEPELRKDAILNTIRLIPAGTGLTVQTPAYLVLVMLERPRSEIPIQLTDEIATVAYMLDSQVVLA